MPDEERAELIEECEISVGNRAFASGNGFPKAELKDKERLGLGCGLG